MAPGRWQPGSWNELRLTSTPCPRVEGNHLSWNGSVATSCSRPRKLDPAHCATRNRGSIVRPVSYKSIAELMCPRTLTGLISRYTNHPQQRVSTRKPAGALSSSTVQNVIRIVVAPPGLVALEFEGVSTSRVSPQVHILYCLVYGRTLRIQRGRLFCGLSIQVRLFPSFRRSREPECGSTRWF
jgi:hypothetical protein